MKAASVRSRPRRVLIVDDHPLVRHGLAKIINQQADLVVCGEAANAREGLAAVIRLQPDVVIVDLSLEEGNGIGLIKDIHARRSGVPVLVLSMHPESLYAERVIRAGARGYLMKREPVGVVLNALGKVLAGQVVLSEEMDARLLTARKRPGKTPATFANLLSDRELEIFCLLGQGVGTRAIARQLHVAISTVETHRANLKRKLGLRNANELVSTATRFVAEANRP